MKKNIYAVFVFVLAAMVVSACKKDSEDISSQNDNQNVNENPFESIEVNLGTNDSLSILTQDSVIFESDDYYFEMEYGSGRVYGKAATEIKVSAIGNMIAELVPYKYYSSWYGYYRQAYAENLECSIVSVGAVDNLSKVETIPERGWATQVAINQGHGYIVKMEGEWYHGHFCKYARVYVKQLIGGGVTIQYQPNWKETYTTKKFKKFVETIRDQYLTDVI